MLSIETLPVGQMKANCYIVYDKADGVGVIIDPGDDAEYIHDRIVSLDLKIVAILATHTHYDHLMAVMELKLAYSAPFIINKPDEILLTHYRRSALYFSQIDPGPAPTPDKYYSDIKDVQIGGNILTVVDTPGHTPGGVCLYSSANKVCFTGDTVFADGDIGRWDFPYSDKASLLESVSNVLLLPEETILYPGHGKLTTVGKERVFHKLF